MSTGSSPSKHVTIAVDPTFDASKQTTTHHHRGEADLRREQSEAYSGEDLKRLAEEAPDDFVVRATAAFCDAHQRGKKPRFDGFSMRNWNEQCRMKYQKNAASENSHRLITERPDGGEAAMALRLPPMTEAEVREHNEPDDLWIVFRGIVYDCTAWQRFHPGGEAIVRACGGRDGTEVYDFYHKWVDCAGLMAAYAVGRLVKE